MEGGDISWGGRFDPLVEILARMVQVIVKYDSAATDDTSSR